MRICRILNGLWQVSGAHGAIDPAAALASMRRYHDAGFVTWDLADHYGPAEDFVGKFHPTLPAPEREKAHFFTKWVPRPGPISRPMVEQAIETSRRRMNMDTVDVLQFHWWIYRDAAYLDALRYLAELQAAGKIRHLALTNFDTKNLRMIVEGGIRIITNQVQYSIIDSRPEVQMMPYCQQKNIQLLTYGTLCGGLLSAKYLHQAEPDRAALDTASLRKYKQMIDMWGGWELFQVLLRVLHQIAEKHSVTVDNVAVRYILDKPTVAGVIAGARLGVRDHFVDNARVFSFALDSDDVAQIHAVTAQARDLFSIIGDCGDEYRR
jgi:aryl-alcohol dehydrogenase-like predicted oxidoreductase